MDRIDHAVNVLQDKINALIRRYDEEKIKNDELRESLSEAHKTLEERRQRIEQLEHKIENIHLGKVFSGSDQKPEKARTRINEMLREIDKCIALLNE